MFEVPKFKKHLLTRNQIQFMDFFEKYMHKIIEEEEFSTGDYDMENE